MSALLESSHAATPTPRDAGLAGESGARLARHVDAGRETVRVSVQDETGAESVVVPMAAFRLFTEVLGAMARGEAVAVVPTRAELTTQEAADLLNVSRPFLVNLLDAGTIPHHKVGTHRRVRLDDLAAYRRAAAAAQRRALEELVEEGQALGLG